MRWTAHEREATLHATPPPVKEFGVRCLAPRALLVAEYFIMNPVDNMTGSLLVAHPSLRDPNFRRTIIFLSHHSPGEGASGFVLNRPLDESFSIGSEAPEIGVYFGGPVEPGQILMASLQWRVSPTVVAFRTFIDSQPGEIQIDSEWMPGLRAFAGYSGWGRGQLEQEIAQNAWIVIPPTRELIEIPPPSDAWKHIMRKSGPMLHLLSEAPDDPAQN